MADEQWRDLNEQVNADWKAETTPFERMYEIIDQTHYCYYGFVSSG